MFLAGLQLLADGLGYAGCASGVCMCGGAGGAGGGGGGMYAYMCVPVRL